MMDTRQAVARALCKRENHNPDTKTPTGRLMWTLWLDDADAAIAAHLKALESAGMVVVPREPTEAMLDEAYLEIADKDGAARSYRAMLSAAQGVDR